MRNGGEWLLRIEDIDPTREVPGATTSIIRSLEAHGFEFETPLLQSTRLDAYEAAIETLLDTNHAFRCSCTRQALLKTASRGRAGMIYPGTCRNGADERDRPAISVRLRTKGTAMDFEDAWQGPQHCNLEQEIGDFLLRRGDGHIAYQLAVALDDAEQHITTVVRGTDLLDSTFMQLLVIESLAKKPPEYAHFPVVTDDSGSKLSKQTGALEIDNNQPNINLLRALSFLLQEPPDSLRTAPTALIWGWVRENWDPNPIKGIQSRPERSIMVR